MIFLLILCALHPHCHLFSLKKEERGCLFYLGCEMTNSGCCGFSHLCLFCSIRTHPSFTNLTIAPNPLPIAQLYCWNSIGVTTPMLYRFVTIAGHIHRLCTNCTNAIYKKNATTLTIAPMHWQSTSSPMNKKNYINLAKK